MVLNEDHILINNLLLLQRLWF